MSHILYRIGNFAGRHPWRVISAWVLAAFAIVMLNGSIGGAPDESFSLPGAESQRAADAIQDRFPQETLYSSNVVFHAEDDTEAVLVVRHLIVHGERLGRRRGSWWLERAARQVAPGFGAGWLHHYHHALSWARMGCRPAGCPAPHAP